MGTAFLTLLSALGPLSIAVALVVIGQLSQRLGLVTKIPPYYRGAYVAAGLVLAATVLRLLGTHVPQEVLLAQAALLASGVTLGVIVAWRYWNWLFGEGNH